MKKNHSHIAGSSLIEVLISLVVVGLILTGVATTLVYSMKTTAEAKYKSVASQKAQELLEVFRRERMLLGWEAFYDGLSIGSTYCFNTLPEPKSENFTDYKVANQSTECSTPIDNSPYKIDYYRSAQIFQPDGTSDIRVIVTVSWTPGERPKSIELEQTFSQW